MNVGIVGSGNIGATAARLFADAGHEVAVSNSRGPESLVPLVEEIGFAPVDTGSLRDGGRRRKPGSPIYNVPMTAGHAREELARRHHRRFWVDGQRP
jgi:predicted dinucleotide-binding enzyme